MRLPEPRQRGIKRAGTVAVKKTGAWYAMIPWWRLIVMAGALALAFVLGVPWRAWAATLPQADDVETPGEIADELGVSPHTEAWLADDSSNPGTTAHAHAGRSRVVVVVDRAVRTPESPQGQTATVYVDGKPQHRWDVSTGRTKMEVALSGKRYLTKTPIGFFRPTRMHRLWRSKVWEAEMKWAVFFVDGIAFHAAAPNQIRTLGRRASGGCVRLRPGHARTLFRLIARSATERPVPQVDRDGKDLATAARPGWDTLIIIEDSSMPVRYGRGGLQGERDVSR